MTEDVSTFLNYWREDSHIAIDIHTHEGWFQQTMRKWQLLTKNLLPIVYFRKYFPFAGFFTNEHRLSHISCQRCDVVANACVLIAYMGAHQVEYKYKDGL